MKINIKIAFFLIGILLLLMNRATAQIKIGGTVQDKKSEPIIGANIYLEGSYDGAITDLDGNFNFTTSKTGDVNLIISYLGYETINRSIDLSEDIILKIKMRESAATLDAVEISASAFKAGDNSKVAVLKPLDIVTTAGSMGDVIAAMQTLPGTQSNADDGRLFVRGGDARETNIYVDGLKVFTPYTRTIGGTPARGRFSPFLFKGVNFSTGAYSSEYGQALSGILNMNTIDDPRQSQTNLSFMSVGLGVGHTEKWEKQSLSFSTSYIDLTPYQQIIDSRLGIVQPFRGFSGEAVFRNKTKNGLLKAYVNGDTGSFKIDRYNLDTRADDRIEIKNSNLYSNTSFNTTVNENRSLFTGLSIGYNKDRIVFNGETLRSENTGLHYRMALKDIISDHFILNYGVESILQIDEVNSDFFNDESIFDNQLKRAIPASFIESDYFFSKNLAIKPGLRWEYNSLLNEHVIMPRLTIAQKLGDNSQLSAAYGVYRQEPNPESLYYDQLLFSEQATHSVINYNYKNDNKIFRLEAYYKSYDKLVTYDFENDLQTNLSNQGNGYAYGFDVFYRANQVIKYVDFWVSYSWIENRRKFRNFPELATPQFSTQHNFSFIMKKWFPELKSQLGATYNFASGRPYENPNTEGFLNELSKPFHNVSMSWSYLISQQKILFASVSNIFNFKNEFGYRYASNPDTSGQFASELIRPNEDQFFFIGFFLTISPDKSLNQLDKI